MKSKVKIPWSVLNRRITLLSILVIMFLSLTSCATYKKKIPNRLLNKKNVSQIEGTYSAISIQDSILIEPGNWHAFTTNFLKEIDRQKKDDTLGLKINDTYSFTLRMQSPKMMSVTYIINDSIVRERDIKVKIRNNGYIQLRNKNLIFKGYPPFLWAYDNKRVRLTVDEDNHLVMDTASDRFGALLIVVGGSTYKGRYSFEKINL